MQKFATKKTSYPQYHNKDLQPRHRHLIIFSVSFAFLSKFLCKFDLQEGVCRLGILIWSGSQTVILCTPLYPHMCKLSYLRSSLLALWRYTQLCIQFAHNLHRPSSKTQKPWCGPHCSSAVWRPFLASLPPIDWLLFPSWGCGRHGALSSLPQWNWTQQGCAAALCHGHLGCAVWNKGFWTNFNHRFCFHLVNACSS